MIINLKKVKKDEIDNDEVNIIVEYSNENENIDNFIGYINNYDDTSKIFVNKDNELVQIDIKDIILFYSDKKYNYCKTLKDSFKIKSKLYELEKMSIDFLRISKSCIVNIKQVKCFDIGETGKIVVRFFDNSEEIVSRRRIKDVMNYLDERRI